MKNNITYYQHYVNSHSHPKFKTLRVKYGWEGEGKFWALNNMIADADECWLDLGQEYNKSSIALDLNFTEEEFMEFIEYLHKKCRLIIYEDGRITTDIIQEILLEVSKDREAARARHEKSRSKKADKGGQKEISPENSENDDEKQASEENFARKSENFARKNIQSKVKESKVKENKEEEVTPPENSEEQIPIHKLNIFIQENCPNVAKIKTQMSYEQCKSLLAENKDNPQRIKEVLESMENKKGVQKEYTSVYLTLKNWIKKEKIWEADRLAKLQNGYSRGQPEQPRYADDGKTNHSGSGIIDELDQIAKHGADNWAEMKKQGVLNARAN